MQIALYWRRWRCDLWCVQRQRLKLMVRRHWRAGNCGGDDQVGQGNILLQENRARSDDCLPGADVVFIGDYDFLYGVFRIGLLRASAPRRRRLHGLRRHRRQVLRELIAQSCSFGRRGDDLRLVQPGQVNGVNCEDHQRMSQE